METKRAELLSVSGIGPETADSILLYAGGYPAFVVDAYTKRVMARHGLFEEDIDYEDLRSLFMNNLPADAALFNEFHALFVASGETVLPAERAAMRRLPAVGGFCEGAVA